ncbi:MAG TPA: N-acetylmuramoyl-L-alanine amidase, partial [candidate division Zixibacteria bacterium]|nr:N-acetylmuramoyl-L-alanine amidase [candidate division Zixibacteria bacterium]
SELAEVVGGSLDWETVGHTVVYQGERDRFRFLIGSPWMQLNDSAYNLVHAVELVEGQLFVPAATFTPYLDRIVPQQATWAEEARRLRLDTDVYNVTDIAFSPKANGLLIEIFLSTALSYEAFTTQGNYLNVSIRNGVLNRTQILSRRDRRLMYDLNAYQVTGAAQISIRLMDEIKEWHHRLLQNPPRIQISIADQNFVLAPAEPDTPPAVGPDNRIDVIVIDAGHGGKQYGAIGPTGAREKDVALDIARNLARLIRKDKQFKVIMTRDRDTTVTLEERAKIANDAGCDLFISIHANSSTKRHVAGWNVFFLAPARNDSARAVAQFENSAFLRDQAPPPDSEEAGGSEEALFGDPVLSILNEMIMTEFQSESHDFAMMCDREFRRALKTTARGVDQAGFFVLNRVYAPSVLIETGFISNRNEERLLRTPEYQEAVAKALYDAVKRFKAKYERFAEEGERSAG